MVNKIQKFKNLVTAGVKFGILGIIFLVYFIVCLTIVLFNNDNSYHSLMSAEEYMSIVTGILFFLFRFIALVVLGVKTYRYGKKIKLNKYKNKKSILTITVFVFWFPCFSFIHDFSRISTITKEYTQMVEKQNMETKINDNEWLTSKIISKDESYNRFSAHTYYKDSQGHIPLTTNVTSNTERCQPITDDKTISTILFSDFDYSMFANKLTLINEILQEQKISLNVAKKLIKEMISLTMKQIWAADNHQAMFSKLVELIKQGASVNQVYKIEHMNDLSVIAYLEHIILLHVEKGHQLDLILNHVMNLGHQIVSCNKLDVNFVTIKKNLIAKILTYSSYSPSKKLQWINILIDHHVIEETEKEKLITLFTD